MSYQNAVSAQQQATLNAQAATTQGVALLYGVDTASTGLATKETP
ncbi:MAG: RebB family R body protein [Deltaproteobacteria bacterium]|nr:RebB family R body protein [Deltaproteobacteria bacterium]